MPEELAANPFWTTGRTPPEKFIGRVRELAVVKSRLDTRQNVSLVGPSRIGKSSLLYYICQKSEELLGPDLRCVYLDLQRIRSDDHFWQEAIQALGGKGRDPAEILGLSRDRPAVLCIDEFEKAAQAKAFSAEFWHNLRSYAQEPTLAILMATSQSLDSLEPDHKASPLANVFTPIDLGNFSDDEARHLIDAYLADTGVSFDEAEIIDLLAKGQGHPATLQNVCFEHFDRRQAGGGPAARLEAAGAFTPDTSQADDWLWNGVYGDALADFILHPETSPPLVIGVNAPWGAGKSSLMEAVRDRLDPEHDKEGHGPSLSLSGFKQRLKTNAAEKTSTIHSEKDCLTVWFNAWKYSKAEQLWAALLQCILRQVTRRMNPVEREAFFLRLNLRRLDHDRLRSVAHQTLLTRIAPRLIGFVVLFLGTLWAFLSGTVGWTGHIYPFFGFALIGGNALTLGAVLWKWWTTKQQPLPFKLADYVKRPQYAQKIGFLGDLEDDLHRLQDLIAGQRLVIFVDDLDRCSPRKVVDLIEAVNVFFGMDRGRWIFVLGLDAGFIEASIESTYEKVIGALKERNGDTDATPFGRQFLEKIVQVWLTLPTPRGPQLESYLASVLRAGYQNGDGTAPGSTVEESVPSHDQSASGGDAQETTAGQGSREPSDRDEPRTPEEPSEDAEDFFTERDPKVQTALQQAVVYLDKNPRQVKRFLNLFRLAALVDSRKRKLAGRGLPEEHFRRLAFETAPSQRSIPWPISTSNS